MAADNRATLKVDRDLFETLDADRGDRTWNQYLEDLHDEAPIKRDVDEIPDEQVREIARLSAEHVEERMRG